MTHLHMIVLVVIFVVIFILFVSYHIIINPFCLVTYIIDAPQDRLDRLDLVGPVGSARLHIKFESFLLAIDF